MQSVSNAWKKAYTETLSPETFVEIDLLMGRSIQKGEAWHQVSATSLAYDDVNDGYKLHQGNPMPPAYAATLEENLWILDGTRKIMKRECCTNMGLCSYRDSHFRYVVNLFPSGRQMDTLHTLTIVWSGEYKEYPHSFKIEVIQLIPPEGEGVYENVILKSITVTDNNSYISQVPIDVAEYDKIKIEALDWNTPNHRRRMDQMFLGKTHRFDKTDIISFTHEQTCDLMSATLPKNAITFSVNNLDGRWNPHNPTGDGVYLMERQAVSVRYGTSIGAGVEWIPGGTFFLSEWNAPSNGAECTFVARDVFEFLLREKSSSQVVSLETTVGVTSVDTMNRFIDEVGLVYSGITANPNDSFDVTTGYLGGVLPMVELYADLSIAENFQLIANANMRILHHNRDNLMCMSQLNNIVSDYPMPLTLAYSYPEITLSKPLRDVVIKTNIDADGDGETELTDNVVLAVRNDGESQTVDNRLLYDWSDEKLNSYAEWVRDTLVSRKTVSGEFRADPRLEVLDVVKIESKYGVIEPVALTTVKYTYGGSFRGYYEGRVLGV